MIREFQGQYRFLSNFEGGVEQRYQSFKTLDMDERAKILKMGPGEAKRYGRTVKIRPNWDAIKLIVMETFVRHKFLHEPYRSMLLSTGNEELQEGNRFRVRDTFWGVDLDTGKGQNHLGKILMKIRAELQQEKEPKPGMSDEEYDYYLGTHYGAHND